MRKIEIMTDLSGLGELKKHLDHEHIEEMLISELKDQGHRGEGGYRRGEYGERGTGQSPALPGIKLELFMKTDQTGGLMETLEGILPAGFAGNAVLSRCRSYETAPPERMSPAGGEGSPVSVVKDGRTDDIVFYWNVSQSPRSDVMTVSISAKNSPELFSVIAGVFTLNGFDILSAKKYLQNDETLDIFKVRPARGAVAGTKTAEFRMARAKRDLTAALTGRDDLPARVRSKISAYQAAAPPSPDMSRIVVDNKSALLFTVVRVTTRDFPGLLFSVTHALLECGLDVRMAKISTKGDQAEDLFYVKTLEGSKVDSPGLILAIKMAVGRALGEG